MNCSIPNGSCWEEGSFSARKGDGSNSDVGRLGLFRTNPVTAHSGLRMNWDSSNYWFHIPIVDFGHRHWVNFADHQIRSQRPLPHDDTARSNKSLNQLPVDRTSIHIEKRTGLSHMRHLRIRRMKTAHSLHSNQVRFVWAHERIDAVLFRMESTQLNQLDRNSRIRAIPNGNCPDDHTVANNRAKFLAHLSRRTLLRPEPRLRYRTVLFSFSFPSKDTKRRFNTTQGEKCSLEKTRDESFKAQRRPERTQQVVRNQCSSSRARGRKPLLTPTNPSV